MRRVWCRRSVHAWSCFRNLALTTCNHNTVNLSISDNFASVRQYLAPLLFYRRRTQKTVTHFYLKMHSNMIKLHQNSNITIYKLGSCGNRACTCLSWARNTNARTDIYDQPPNGKIARHSTVKKHPHFLIKKNLWVLNCITGECDAFLHPLSLSCDKYYYRGFLRAVRRLITSHWVMLLICERSILWEY